MFNLFNTVCRLVLNSSDVIRKFLFLLIQLRCLPVVVPQSFFLMTNPSRMVSNATTVLYEKYIVILGNLTTNELIPYCGFEYCP